MQTLILAALIGLIAGAAAFGLVAAAFVGVTVPLLAGAVVAAVVTSGVVAKIRPMDATA